MNEEQQEIAERAYAHGTSARATWSFGGDQVVQNTAGYPGEARELLRWAYQYCIDPRHPIGRDEFARRLGYSDNVIYKVYSGRYLHPETGEPMSPPAKMMQALRNFKQVESARNLLGGKRFVATPTAEAVWELCDLCRESQTPGFIFGASQIGKTTALENYAVRNNHGSTVYVRLAAASGLNGMMRQIAQSVGVSPKTETKKLVERTKRAITSGMLLIVDEVHLLIYTYRKESFFSCIEVLRDIYDCTKCGLVLSMTNLGRDRFEQARRRELEQMFRRGVHRLELGKMPTQDDLDALLADWGLAWSEAKKPVTAIGQTDSPFQIIRQLARDEGLTAIIERLRYARRLATQEKTELSWERFLEAHLLIRARAIAPASW